MGIGNWRPSDARPFATKCPSRLQSKPSASGRKRPPISFIFPPTLLRLFGRLLAGFRRWALFPRWRRSRRHSGPLLGWRLNMLRRRLRLPRLRRRLHLPWLWRRLHLMLRLRRRRWLKATLLRRRLRERRRLRRDWPHDRWLLLRRTVRRSLGPAQLRLRWRWRDCRGRRLRRDWPHDRRLLRRRTAGPGRWTYIAPL
jgi:hypothetical protein